MHKKTNVSLTKRQVNLSKSALCSYARWTYSDMIQSIMKGGGGSNKLNM